MVYGAHAIFIHPDNLKEEKPFWPMQAILYQRDSKALYSSLLVSLRRTLDALGKRLDPVP